MADDDKPTSEDEDRVAIPLDPVIALQALLRVDPNAKPMDADDEPQNDSR